MAVGDVHTSYVGLLDGQISLWYEWQIAATSVDADGAEVVTSANPLRFAYVDRRTIRTGTVRGYNFDSGTLDEQYLSADPENPTWHEIRPAMRKFFDGTGGITGGWRP